MSAPLLAMGSGLLLSTCGIVPASAPAYDLVLTAPCPSIYGNEAIHTCQFNAVDFFHAESCSKPELIKTSQPGASAGDANGSGDEFARD